VLNAAPFSMGILTNRPPPEWHPAAADVKAACTVAARQWDRRGVDIAELALRFSLSEPRIASTFVGMATTEDVRRNAAWSEKGPAHDLMDAACASLDTIRNRAWTAGLPEIQ